MRKHVLYCATALTIFLVGMMMVSDLFVRSQDIPGTDPKAWDTLGSVSVGFLAAMLVVSWITSDD